MNYFFSGPESPKKRGREPKGLLSSWDGFDEDAIRRKIYEFYSANKLPTIQMLLVAIQDLDPKYAVCETSLRRFVKKRLNFK